MRAECCLRTPRDHRPRLECAAIATKPRQTKHKKDPVARLVPLAEELGCVHEAVDDLDEQVHDAKGSKASRINNQVLDAQLDYLIEVGYDLEGIEEISLRSNTKPKPEELP